MILGEGLNYSYTSKIIGKEETEKELKKITNFT